MKPHYFKHEGVWCVVFPVPLQEVTPSVRLEAQLHEMRLNRDSDDPRASDLFWEPSSLMQPDQDHA